MDRRQFGEEAWSAVEQQQQQQQPTAKSRQQGLPEETRPGQLCRSQGYSAAHSDAAAAAAAPVAAVSSDSASAVAAAVAAVAAPVVAVAAVAAAAAAAAAPRPRLKRQDTPWEEPLLLHQGTSSSSDLSSVPEVDEWWDQVLSAEEEEDGGKEAFKGTSTLAPPPPPQPSLARSHPPRRRKQRVDPLDMMTLEEVKEGGEWGQTAKSLFSYRVIKARMSFSEMQ